MGLSACNLQAFAIHFESLRVYRTVFFYSNKDSRFINLRTLQRNTFSFIYLFINFLQIETISIYVTFLRILALLRETSLSVSHETHVEEAKEYRKIFHVWCK